LFHPYVVNDQEIGLQILAQELVFFTQDLIVQKVTDDIEDGAVQDQEAGLDGLVANGLAQARAVTGTSLLYSDLRLAGLYKILSATGTQRTGLTDSESHP
jgi:hypothetical protein